MKQITKILVLIFSFSIVLGSCPVVLLAEGCPYCGGREDVREGRIEEIREDSFIIDLGEKDRFMETCLFSILKPTETVNPIDNKIITEWKLIGEGILEFAEEDKGLAKGYILNPGEELKAGYKVSDCVADIDFNKWEVKYKKARSGIWDGVFGLILGSALLTYGDDPDIEWDTTVGWIYLAVGVVGSVYGVSFPFVRKEGKKKKYLEYLKLRKGISYCGRNTNYRYPNYFREQRRNKKK